MSEADFHTAIREGNCAQLALFLSAAHTYSPPSQVCNLALQQIAAYPARATVHSAMVRLFLADERPERAKPAADQSEVLSIAVRQGHVELVRLLLTDTRPGRVCPKARQSVFLSQAAESGQWTIFRLLFEDSRPDRARPSADRSLALWSAIATGRVEIVQRLLEDTRPERVQVHDRAFMEAAVKHRRSLELVRLLLAVAPSQGFGSAMLWAAQWGQVEVFRLLLAARPAQSPPNTRESEMLRLAAHHSEIVRLLLADPRPNRALPSDCSSEVLVKAAEQGSVESVRLLLADAREHRALPNAQNSLALRLACKNGHVEVVRLLLADVQHERALPDAEISEALRSAATMPSREEICRLLLQDRKPHRVWANAGLSAPLQQAAWEGSVPLTRLLLRQSDVFPSEVVWRGLLVMQRPHAIAVLQALFDEARIWVPPVVPFEAAYHPGAYTWLAELLEQLSSAHLVQVGALRRSHGCRRGTKCDTNRDTNRGTNCGTNCGTNRIMIVSPKARHALHERCEAWLDLVERCETLPWDQALTCAQRSVMSQHVPDPILAAEEEEIESWLRNLRSRRRGFFAALDQTSLSAACQGLQSAWRKWAASADP